MLFGIRFDSKREATRYLVLLNRQRKGEIRNLALQRKFELLPAAVTPDGKRRAIYYIADFTYEENDNLVVEDAKGYQTDLYKLKKRMMFDKYGIWIKET